MERELKQSSELTLAQEKALLVEWPTLAIKNFSDLVRHQHAKRINPAAVNGASRPSLHQRLYLSLRDAALRSTTPAHINGYGHCSDIPHGKPSTPAEMAEWCNALSTRLRTRPLKGYIPTTAHDFGG